MSSNHHHHHHGSPLRTSAHATLHCLIGCAIGEAFVVAWPVNHWLLKKELRAPH